jgi:4'-phosphopantetheinyl transferase
MPIAMNDRLAFATDAHLPSVTWSEPPATLALANGAVHLWRVPLAGDDAALLAVLSADERQRAAAFQFEQHRRRYIVGRARLREILGRYVGEAAASIRFQYGPHRKPSLAAHPDVHFNFSGSDHLGLVAVRGSGPVGIDVESLARDVDHVGIAASYFSPVEADAIRAASGTERAERFFARWTAREAALKALGVGLSGLRTASASEQLFAGLQIRHFSPAPGFLAALATPATA